MFDCIEDYAPGFKASVIGRDILTPPDLERIFGLPGGVGTTHVNSEHRSGGSAGGHTGLGQAQPTHTALCWQNIFHGGMSLDQLYFARPAPSYSGYRSPIPGLYLCGSGAHPGEQSWEPGPSWGPAEGRKGHVEEVHHHSPFLLSCRRRSDGSSRTQCCPGGYQGFQAPLMRLVTLTSPTQVAATAASPTDPTQSPAHPQPASPAPQGSRVSQKLGAGWQGPLCSQLLLSP